MIWLLGFSIPPPSGFSWNIDSIGINGILSFHCGSSSFHPSTISPAVSCMMTAPSSELAEREIWKWSNGLFFPSRVENSTLRWSSNEVLLALTNTDIWEGYLINFVPSRKSSYKGNSSFLKDIPWSYRIHYRFESLSFKLSNHTLLILHTLLISDKNNLLNLISIFQKDLFFQKKESCSNIIHPIQKSCAAISSPFVTTASASHIRTVSICMYVNVKSIIVPRKKATRKSRTYYILV